MNEPQGYLSAAYAHSLAEWGEPVQLPRSGGWLLRRKIPGSTEHDFMGLYPIFSCLDWSGLEEDLAEIAKDGVAVSLVTDPFADVSLKLLRKFFPDRCYAFKKHYVADLRLIPEKVVLAHHRRNARRAQRRATFEMCATPLDYLEEWTRLYANLVERHEINGLLRFSLDSFAALFRVPGFRLFRAEIDRQTAGFTVWLVQNDVAYWHLSAYSTAGYKACVSYGLMWHAWESFLSEVKWHSLGGVAGTSDRDDGLAFFKQGWATQTREVYFCGRVLQEDKYRRLTPVTMSGGHFPAYRAGEFA